MNRFCTLMIALGAMLFTAPAFSADPAAPRDNWYFELKVAGGVVLTGEKLTVTGVGKGVYDADGQYAGEVVLGKYFAPMWRAEVAFSLAHGEDGSFDAGGGPVLHKGNLNVYTTMANILYEIDIGQEIRPFVGFGAGVAVIDADNLGGGAFATDDTKAVFVGALHAGVDLPINEIITFTTRFSLGIFTGATFDTTLAGTTTRKGTHVLGAGTIGIRVNLN